MAGLCGEMCDNIKEHMLSWGPPLFRTRCKVEMEMDWQCKERKGPSWNEGISWLRRGTLQKSERNKDEMEWTYSKRR